MSDLDQRIVSLEQRMLVIESQLSARTPLPVQPKPVPVKTQIAHPLPKPDPINATQLMAWCAGITFFIATLYFLKLVYDTGWLTPVRQVSLAYLAAASLITFGFVLQRKDQFYSAYLPAVGLVVLYLTTLVAHLVYGIISPLVALATVGVITLLGVWLGRHYQKTVYLIFSAIGVYASPLVVQGQQTGLIDLVVYYSAWSLLFSFSAVQENRRLTYLLPMYLAILGFDAVFRSTGSNEWIMAVLYQLVQFLIFAFTTVIFSVKNKRTMKQDEVFPHGIALFLFYAIEYARLQEHLPNLVDYFALLSGVVVYGLYTIAKHHYRGPENIKSGAILVSYYCSWVVLHAVFFGVVSHNWLPWAALLAPLIYFKCRVSTPDHQSVLLPIRLACGAVFVSGYLMLLGAVLIQPSFSTPEPAAALCLYAGLIYGIYWKLRKDLEMTSSSSVLLYAGHLAFMSALATWVDHNIYLSALWTLYGVVLLVLALKVKDKAIGKSALLLFSVAAFKVLFFDLSGTNSMTRVLVLVVVSASLYAGGWLYQSLVGKENNA